MATSPWSVEIMFADSLLGTSQIEERKRGEEALRFDVGLNKERFQLIYLPSPPPSSLSSRLSHSLRPPRIGEDLGRLDGDPEVIRVLVRLARLVVFYFVSIGEGCKVAVEVPIRKIPGSRELWRGWWMETGSVGRERKGRKERRSEIHLYL